MWNLGRWAAVRPGVWVCFITRLFWRPCVCVCVRACVRVCVCVCVSVWVCQLAAVKVQSPVSGMRSSCTDRLISSAAAGSNSASERCSIRFNSDRMNRNWFWNNQRSNWRDWIALWTDFCFLAFVLWKGYYCWLKWFENEFDSFWLAALLLLLLLLLSSLLQQLDINPR